MSMKRNGFTLVEILIASMIGAFIMLVAVGALKAISVSAQIVDSNIDVASELRFVAARISTDLNNFYRDGNAENTKLVGRVVQVQDDVLCILTFYTVGRTKARAEQSEGDVYEVEYFLRKDEDKTYLMRRLWPNPDKKSQAGGILSVIAEDIDTFMVRYFDGRDWQIQWPEEQAAPPELVEVILASNTSVGATQVTESFIVNLKKARLQRSIQDLGQQQQQGTPEPEGEQGQEQQVSR
jgi:general secretion pathway protein J